MKPSRGYLMLLTLVFGAIFLTVLGAISSFVLSENRIQSHVTAKSRGLVIAEAGLEYGERELAGDGESPKRVGSSVAVSGIEPAGSAYEAEW